MQEKSTPFSLSIIYEVVGLVKLYLKSASSHLSFKPFHLTSLSISMDADACVFGATI